MPYNIDLSTADEVDPDTEDFGFWVDGSVITERTSSMVATSKLPRCQRVTLMRLGGGLARLNMGSFSRVAVSVTGEASLIERLRREVL